MDTTENDDPLLTERLCKDCYLDTLKDGQSYAVRLSTWKAAHRASEPLGGYLCVLDLEKRLGRELKAWDFLECDLTNALHAQAHDPFSFFHPTLRRRVRSL